MKEELFFELLHQKGIEFRNVQRKALTSEKPALLLLAVPGSGKTTVLVSRIAFLSLCQNVPPSRMLIMTFSREAARDMERRYIELFGEFGSETPRFSTIHSFCYRVLGYYAKSYRRQMPKLLADAGQEASRTGLIREIYREVTGEFLSPQDDLLERILNHISLSKNLLLTAEDRQALDEEMTEFSDIFSEYEKRKKALGLMDFDDMLTFALSILRQCPPVRKHFQNAYDYLLVDEAQDTSKSQYEIISLLARQMKLFVVGDEDQCIYSFRGAYPEGLLRFPEDYPGAEILKLEQNYRSRAKIVSTANDFIKINHSRYEKEMFTTERGEGEILFRKLSDYRFQGEETVKEIKSLLPDETAAVLYRNHESMIPVIDLLEREEIPYYTREKQVKFFSHFIVRDILAFFTLSYDPCNLEAFEQIYYKCMCSKMVLIYVKHQIGKYNSVFEAAADSPEASPFLREKWRRCDKALSRLRLRSPLTAIRIIEEKLGYREYLKKRSNASWAGAALKMGILKTVAEPLKTLEEFAQRMAFLEERCSRGGNCRENAAVTLSTLHSAKGLEFDTVLLLDCVEGILPGEDAAKEFAMEQPEEMEGEARLFYVGITRAKKRLVIYFSDYYHDELAVRSRFVTRLMPPEERRRFRLRNTEEESRLSWLMDREVSHKFFGQGTVIGIGQGDSILVMFDKYGRKELSYYECRKSRVLKVLKEPVGREREKFDQKGRSG